MNIGKIKVAIVLLLSMIIMATTVNAEASYLGWRPVPDLTGTMYKSTSDDYSILTIGDISMFGDIKACTESYYSPIGIIISTPPTTCSKYSTQNLNYLSGFPAYIGQPIKLRIAKTSNSYPDYYVEVTDWDFR